jgi:hypothetical protein
MGHNFASHDSEGKQSDRQRRRILGRTQIHTLSGYFHLYIIKFCEECCSGRLMVVAFIDLVCGDEWNCFGG